ncbi:hypothetical protein KP509_36G058300 [Ceratopteris richardii]|uniref:Uncharacterized protein n=1 Tax=Ceratopteris richardii TaxID=49495 RepID=A0A8T2QDL0_CERRI|nr:hypothetical protein KP509_36G058300 [Ceratopteris richardii]
MTRTIYGATIGALAGVGIGLYKRQNPFTWFTSMGANCAIATCCFCGFQELTRELRAADPDDWANSFLGGLASGALLGRLHGTGINFGALLLKEYRLRHLLAAQVSNEGDKATVSASKQSLLSALYNFELPEWSPIQKLDEEEAKRRLVERENQRRRTLDSLQTGSLPAKDN